MVKVYSTAPISHGFDINGKKYVIKGTNSYVILNSSVNNGAPIAPYVTEMDETIFAQIQDKYKMHIYVFGGVLDNGEKIEPLIYTAKSDSDALKRSKDKPPVIDNENVIAKQKNIQPFKEN